jgi:peroxiredoxin
MKWRGLEEGESGLGHATLKAALDERRELMRKYVPPDIQAQNRHAVEELRASGLADKILPIGAIAPIFALPDSQGQTVNSAEMLARGPLIVVFFRGRWCPFCVAQLEAWNQLPPQLHAARAEVVAISPQTVHQCDLMRDQHKLRLALLSDPGNRVARQFGLVYRVSDEQQKLFRRTFVNLPFINGDESWELPLPATYLLNRDGRILFAAADPDYTIRPEPEEVLAKFAPGAAHTR